MGVFKMNQTKIVLLLFLLTNIANCVKMRCRGGGLSTRCRGTNCTARCSSNGRVVNFSCESGSTSVTCTNGRNCDVQCGQKINFPPCFPLCGSENPILDGWDGSDGSDGWDVGWMGWIGWIGWIGWMEWNQVQTLL